MNNRRFDHWSRRDFLTKLGLAGSAALLGLKSDALAAEAPPETTRIRLTNEPYICIAPQYAAEELLKAEGFKDVQYVKVGDGSGTQLVAEGKVDFVLDFTGAWLTRLDAGDPVVILSGVHAGCFELFATSRVRSIRDLKDKTVAVLSVGAPEHIFLSIMAAYVGIDPKRDIRWVTHPPAESMRLLAEGKVDAYLAFPPEPQELRAKKIGHVVVSTAADRPWSQYFCCVLAGNRNFVRKNPSATKRLVRAILKANELCAREPEKVARSIVNKGYANNYDYALQALMEISYSQWREYDPEDTMRFYALRLHEAGMIKSSPQKIIAQGTDWRFLKELKKEMKA